MIRWIVLSCFFAASSAAFADDGVLSLNELNKLREVRSVAMSPNGENVAFTLNLATDAYVNGEGSLLREIYVVNQKGKILPFVTGGDALGYVRWSPDGRSIWFLSKREHDANVGVYQINVAGGEARKKVMLSSDIAGFVLHPDGKSILVWGPTAQSAKQLELQKLHFDQQVFEESADKHQLWLVNLEQTNLKPKPIIDNLHVLDAQWIPESKNILVQYAASGLTDDVIMGKQIAVFDRQGNRLNHFSHEGKMSKVKISPDGKSIAVIGSNDPSDPAEGRLLLGSVAGSTLIDLIPDLAGHVQDIDWQSDNTIAFIVHQRLNSFIASKKIDKPSGDYRILQQDIGITTSLSFDEDGKNAALINHTDKHPPELYWYTRKVSGRVTDSNTWLHDKTLSKQQSIEFAARDGTKIDGILYTPDVPNNSKAPLIIFVHGGPEAHISAGWLDRYSQPIQYAVSRGFFVFLPNYRGSTGKGVAFSKLGQGDYAGAEFDDLLDAKQYLVEHFDIASDRVGISGASYGGYAAAWAATKMTSEFAASVSSMGIADQISKFGITDIPSEMIKLHSVKLPWQNWQWLLQRSPIYHVDGATTPLLLLHGQLDTRVPYSQSVELYRHFKFRTKTPVRLVLYPQEGHGFKLAPNKLDYSMRLMRWMEHFLIDKKNDLPAYSLPHDELTVSGPCE